MFTQVLCYILYSRVQIVERLTKIIKGNQWKCKCAVAQVQHLLVFRDHWQWWEWTAASRLPYSIHVHHSRCHIGPSQRKREYSKPWNYLRDSREQRNEMGEHTASSNNSDHNAWRGETFHKLTTRNAIKPALFPSKLSESIYTKDTNRKHFR